MLKFSLWHRVLDGGQQMGPHSSAAQSEGNRWRLWGQSVNAGNSQVVSAGSAMGEEAQEGRRQGRERGKLLLPACPPGLGRWEVRGRS